MAFHRKVVDEAYEAHVRGHADNEGPGFTVIRYAGDCQRPLVMHQDTFDHLHVRREIRCRKCGPCLRARTWYWAMAGIEETRLAHEAGRRTWFGTLTLTAEAQEGLLMRARQSWLDAGHGSHESDSGWWEDQKCDRRFQLVRDVLVHELQNYWKRLRKAGHKFRYLVAIEQHKSGLPHLHWLLHEVEKPIRKIDLQQQWSLGFSKVTIVGGKSKNSADPSRAAFYVVKYLSKTHQARQMASRLYRPKRRSVRRTVGPEGPAATS